MSDPLTLGRTIALVMCLGMCGLGFVAWRRRRLSVLAGWLFGLWATTQLAFNIYSLFAIDLMLIQTLPISTVTLITVVLRIQSYATFGAYMAVILFEKADTRWQL